MAEDGQEEIVEVRVNRIEQLFESLDPSPFHERDLDPKAADYIVNWARDLPGDGPLVLRIHLSEPATGRHEDVAAAIGVYFSYVADMATRDLRETFRMGWRYQIIGIACLALSILGGQVVTAVVAAPVGELLREGLIILGWVANWKPFSTFLYDWIPIRRKRDLYRRLAAARVDIVTAGAR